MLNSSRRARRNMPRCGRLALVVPTALLAITAMVSPSFADDVTPDDGGETPAVTETPGPAAEPEPAPAPDPAPAAEPQSEPKSEPKAGAKSDLASTPTPGAAFTDAAQAKTTESAIAAGKDDKPDDKKVVVCKYVGTPPGVPDHIIVVSKSAIKDWNGTTFPWTFADAQDSVAIRYAVGNEQPGDEELGNCPLEEEALPEIPVDDPCGLDNAVYGAVPEGNYTIVRNLDGSITLKADAGYEFPGGSDEHVFPAPADENIPCEPVVIDEPTVPSSDPCGPDNRAYGAVPDGDYDVTNNDDGSITLTAHTGFVFAGGPTYTYPALVDSGAVCAEVEDEKKVVVCKYVGTPPGVPHHIIVVSKSAALAAGWVEGEFPGPFADEQDSTAIRWAIGNEQPGDEELVNCPVEIEAPEVTISDECEPDNATYGDVPLSDGYSIAYNEDGSITLTALGNRTFPGGEKTFTYPVLVEENTEACPVVDGTRVVLCSYGAPIPTRADPLLGTIEIWDLADLLTFGFAGTFPYEFTNGGITSMAIRFAEEGEVAEDIEGLSCGVDGEIEEENPENPDVPGEVGGVDEAAALPNTGGPAGWLVPFGTALVLAGAALVLARRREIV